MTGKRSKRVNSALVSVGMVALVAGCGGGSAVSNSNGSTTYIPPSKQMATATLSLLVPGRRPSAGTRSPRYVSPYTSRVDVAAVSAGAPSPWPIATSTSIPTPGPVPSGATPSPIPVTMQVPVAVGSAQFSVNTYDSGGYLLSGLVSGPVTISPNTANSVNLVLNAAADCVRVNSGSTFTMTPMIAQSGTQTATFTVTPCDADGYPIPAGQTLSNAITFATPPPATIIVNSNARSPRAALPTPTPGPNMLTFSPNVITAGGDTLVTVTYPAQSASVLMAQAVPSPMPASNAGLGTITADPLYLTLVSNHDSGNVYAFAHDMQGTLPFQSMGYLATGLYPSAIAAAGPVDSNCSGAGQAVVAAQGSLTILSEPNPTQANPTPMPGTLPISGFPNQGTAATLDASCNAYVGDSSGYMYSLVGVSGSSPLLSAPSSSPYSTNPNNYPAGTINATTWFGGTTYVGLGSSSGYLGTYLNNIVDMTTGTDMKVGTGTVAMTRYGTAGLAISYQPSTVCCTNYYLAEVIPSGGLLGVLASKELPGTYSTPVKAIAVDGNGNIWAAASSQLFEFTPSTGMLYTYGLPGGNYNPSAMTAAPDGTLYITDTGSVPGNVYLYSWQNITGGLGSTAQLLGSAPVGNNPSGVTILP